MYFSYISPSYKSYTTKTVKQNIPVSPIVPLSLNEREYLNVYKKDKMRYLFHSSEEEGLTGAVHCYALHDIRSEVDVIHSVGGFELDVVGGELGMSWHGLRVVVGQVGISLLVGVVGVVFHVGRNAVGVGVEGCGLVHAELRVDHCHLLERLPR